MKTVLSNIALVALCLSLVGCSKARFEQMQNIDNIDVNCTPEVLAAVAGKVPATIEVTYPANYFYPKAILVVTPVLVYEGGEAVGESFTYQGSKVKDNNKVISVDGGSVRESFSFNYVDGMQKSYLELRGKAFFKGKTLEVPAIKVADGVNTTFELATACKKVGAVDFKDDGYQDVIRMSTEGQILYEINSANVRSKELKSASISGLQKELKSLGENERVTITGTQIVAYASPEGGESFNAKLSDKRATSAQKAWKKIAKDIEATETEIKSIGQDWEGFQDAVAASNIEDKDLILRVLSMYSDPAVRESEIRNMSQIFTELKDKVFPDLRRARFITSSEFNNYSDAELIALADEYLANLDEASVLHIATISEDNARKEAIYNYAADRFNSDEANYDLAVLALNAGQFDKAEAYVEKIAKVDDEVNNLKGVIALRKGNVNEAAKYFAKASIDDAKENTAIVKMINGDYAGAAAAVKNVSGNNAAVAFLVAGDVKSAEAAIEGDSAVADYLRAIVAARNGNAAAVKANLDSACSKCECFKARAEKDIEFAAYRD